MKMVRLPHDKVELGAPLPWNVRDTEGRLLLSRGHVVSSEEQLQEQGAPRVLIAMEKPEGAFLVTETGAWMASWPEISGTRSGRAEALIAGWPCWPQPPDLIVPIPLHPRRRRQRGYNQSELLARPLAQAVGVAYSATVLQRTRHTPPQVGLGPQARAANVRGAFTAAPDEVRGRAVILIDDVLTTGATMTAAAEALLAVSDQNL